MYLQITWSQYNAFYKDKEIKKLVLGYLQNKLISEYLQGGALQISIWFADAGNNPGCYEAYKQFSCRWNFPTCSRETNSSMQMCQSICNNFQTSCGGSTDVCSIIYAKTVRNGSFRISGLILHADCIFELRYILRKYGELLSWRRRFYQEDQGTLHPWPESRPGRRAASPPQESRARPNSLGMPDNEREKPPDPVLERRSLRIPLNEQEALFALQGDFLNIFPREIHKPEMPLPLKQRNP